MKKCLHRTRSYLLILCRRRTKSTKVNALIDRSFDFKDKFRRDLDLNFEKLYLFLRGHIAFLASTDLRTRTIEIAFNS